MNAKTSTAAEGWVTPADKTSSTDDERIRNKSFEFGDNFIRKPFLVEDLVRKIGELLPK